MAHLSIRVLGELQIWKDDVPVSSFESDKVRALFAYLVVEAGRSHQRESLAGLLWPDCSEGAARHNLSQALFNLRQALGDSTARPPYLLISRDAIQFNRESSCTLDFAEFNRQYSDWEKHRDRESEDPSTLVQLEEMVDLYQGEFLQQFFLEGSAEFEDWILLQREALHQRVMAAHTWLANHCEQHGDFQTARRYVARQLELDPWREEAHCQMMQLLALDGQRSAALAQYETCRKVLAAELSVEPSQKTRELYEQIRSGIQKPREETGDTPLSTPLHDLPASLTPFIGRERELADLSRLIAASECRCITLLGPGGIGKTRLALQAAEQHWNEFAQGAAFIPLASAGTIDAAIPAIAQGIGFSFYGPADPKAQLLKFLRDKQMLLVVDNAEHLLAERPPRGTIADLLVEVLTHAAGVKLLVTSREALQLQEEWLFEVQGLAFPPAERTGRLDEFDAVTLFVQRARRARPGWVLDAQDEAGIVTLCHLVEGMPLAIELAATWVKLLSPAEIVSEIQHNLDFLNAQMRDLPDRHRSMRAVFDHSWQSLSAEEKQVLSGLAVFRGGFTRQAAEQVAGANLSVLSSLLSRSLLRRTSTGRYELHELVRQYAVSRLSENRHDLDSVHERHSLYYLGLLAEKEAQLQSPHQKQALAELSLEINNIRAAWDWAAAQRRIRPLERAATALWYFYELRSWFEEGEEVFGKTAEAFQTDRPDGGQDDETRETIRYSLLAHSGSFKFRQGRSEEAFYLLSPCVEFLRASAHLAAAIASLEYLGITCWELGKFTEAKAYLQESHYLARNAGKRWNEAIAGEFLGIVAHDLGEYPQARQLLEDALLIFRQIGDPSMTAHVLSYLGRTYQVLGDYSAAETLLREALLLTREMDYRFGAGLTLDALGQIASAQGHFTEAAGFFVEGASLFREMGDTHRLSRTLNHQGLNLLALGRMTEARNALIAALRLAHEGGLTPSILNALTGLAAIEAAQAPNREPLVLVITILQQASSNQEAQAIASRLRVELESKLPREEIMAAEEQAAAMSLESLVRGMLASA